MQAHLADHVVEVLNRALKASPEALHELMEYRVPCTAELRNDPTVRVIHELGKEPVVGLLGLINGIVGVAPDKWGYVVACYEDDKEGGKLFKFLVRKTPRKEEASSDEAPPSE